jgi:hypothetical protein
MPRRRDLLRTLNRDNPSWPTRKRRYSYPERALHSNVFQMLGWLKPACVWFPVPNGAADLGQKLAGILKGQGKVKAGVSDFIFMWGFLNGCHVDASHVVSCGGTTCGAIELKSKDGRLTEDQEKFKKECERYGIPYREARSLDEVVGILVEWGRLPADAIQRIRGVSWE